MRNTHSNPTSYAVRRVRPSPILLALSCLLLAPIANAETVVVSPVPSLATGSTSINPDNKSPFNYFTGSNETLKTTLTGDATFRVLQDFTGFTGNAAADKSYVVNNAAGLSDLKFTYGGNLTGAAQISNNSGYATSRADSSIRLQGSTGNTQATFTVSLGTWADDTFTIDRTAKGVGFTLTGNYANLLDDTATVTYYSITGAVLSTQTYTEAASGRAAFTGYLNTTGDASKDVAFVTISFTTDPNTSSWILGLDDFGFTSVSSIPEPESVALLAGSCALVVLAWRRLQN